MVVTFLTLSRIQQDIIRNAQKSSCEATVILATLQTKFIFSRLSKNTRILNFMKMRPVRPEMIHADGRTDRKTVRQTDVTKLIVTFRFFCEEA